jgi:RNA polymerase sigma-70 factor (ECF subfamily)
LNAESDHRFHREIAPLADEVGRLARRLARHHADAEDLVQESMLRAYRGLGGLQEGTNPQAWLYTIVYNTWISAHRARQRRPLEQLTGEFTDRQLAAGNRGLSAHSRSAESEALGDAGDSAIATAFKSLPTQLRHTMYFADVEGLPYAEIARIMKCPVGTVMSRVHRGRRRLRTLLATEGEVETEQEREENYHPTHRGHPQPHRSASHLHEVPDHQLCFHRRDQQHDDGHRRVDHVRCAAVARGQP